MNWIGFNAYAFCGLGHKTIAIKLFFYLFKAGFNADLARAMLAENVYQVQIGR